ncbi:MAG: ABC transporter permease [Thermoanaerobaculia bacterium]|nr:ABC transporter permease [Thermoanaerobaculia bacterium]
MVELRLPKTLSVLDRKLLRELWRIRGQAFAIAGVIGAGLALFIVMLSTFGSLETTQSTYYERYRFADVFASLKRAPEHLVDRIAEIPGVDQARSRVVVGITLDLEGSSEPAGGLILSIPEVRTPILNDLFLRSGRYIEPGHRDEILASEGFTKANGLTAGDSITAVINGHQRVLTIVGIALSPEFIYNIRPGEFLPDEKTYGIFWMERKSLASAYDMDGAFNDVVLRLSRDASAPEVIDRLDRLLEPYGGLGAIPRSLQQSHWYINNELVQLRAMGLVIPAIFLVVAAFLLNIVLSRIVSVQREEIAAVKAVGYSDLALAVHYIKWSLVISTMGVFIGVLFGALMGRGMTSMYVAYFHFPLLQYELPARVVVQAFAISFGSGVLGALTAVRRVVSLPPAEAMRPEPPATFQKTFIERWGLDRFLSQPSRIILRNLQRNPTRAALSLIGIAAGGSLMILGSFSLDAVNMMMDFQFNVAQRHDVMVAFYEPGSSQLRYELSRLPGVLEVEPFRSTRVSLRAGHRERQTSLNGVPLDARLNRLVDIETGPVRVPPEGLMLSSTLAEILHVGAGDEIEIKVLEGRRNRAYVRVSKVVDDIMGTSGYMPESALHRFLEEGDNISGAYLRVDSDHADELYRHLKELPTVAAVVRKQAAIDSFNRVLAKTLGSVRAINVLFAVVIAFGVIYNAARISLSERGRELATLRVIGFRKAEISYILLGEIGLLTFLAIPVSLLLGYGLAAATADAMSTELYRIPLVVSERTYVFSALTTVIATLVSCLIVRRKLDSLDLIAVLKTRE